MHPFEARGEEGKAFACPGPGERVLAKYYDKGAK
jgi:hypothetical protein